MNFPDELLPADVLLYHGDTLFNKITDIKTGGLVDHVEVYMGHGLTVAARQEGFNYYDFNPNGLAKVRRPVAPFDLAAAETWIGPLRGLSYDDPGLFEFFNWSITNNGFICSVGAAYLLKMGGVFIFADDMDLNKISPRDFDLPRELTTIWTKQNV